MPFSSSHIFVITYFTAACIIKHRHNGFLGLMAILQEGKKHTNGRHSSRNQGSWYRSSTMGPYAHSWYTRQVVCIDTAWVPYLGLQKTCSSSSNILKPKLSQVLTIAGPPINCVHVMTQNMQQGVTRGSLQHGCDTGRLSVVMTYETGCTPLGRFNVVNVTLYVCVY